MRNVTPIRPSQKARRPQPIWSSRRAAGIGGFTGLAALFTWPAFASWPETLLIPFAILLTITAFCGLSVLLFSFYDLATRKRGQRMRAVRTFDIIFGLALAVPSLLELDGLFGLI